MIIQRTVVDPITGTAILVGNGDPSGLDAPTGSLFLRKDGGSNQMVYVKYGNTITDWQILASGSGTILPPGVVSSSAQTVANIAGENIAPLSVTTTNSSSFDGVSIGTGKTDDPTNIIIGQNALANLVSGSNQTGSIVIGYNAGRFLSSSTSGSQNYQTGDNIIIGNNAMASASVNVLNASMRLMIAIGSNAMISASGANSIAIGHNTLMSMSRNTPTGTGINASNVAIGNNALERLRFGGSNFGIGPSTLNELTDGISNVAMGSSNLTNLTSGSYNTSIGQSSQGALRLGDFNTSIGWNTLDTLPSGSSNIAIGAHAGRRINSGSNELFINSIDRTNATGDYSSSIIYGRQSPTAASQVLRLNAQVISPYGFTGSLFGTASFATTASYALNAGLKTKVGSIANTSFGSNPLTASITFTTAFADTNYGVVITGEDARAWTIQNKTTSGFVVNTNSSVGLSGTTYWNATIYGES